MADDFDQYGRTPTTQSGVAPDMPKHAQEGETIASEETTIIPGRGGDDGVHPGQASYGPGSLGSDQEGWHPQSDRS